MRKNYQLEKRKYVVGGFLVVIAAIYLIRLFGLQIQDDRYKDYADNNLQKTYSQYITRFDDHLNKVNLALTNSGSTKSRLTLIKNRVDEQQTTIEELKSTNEDRDISDIIIDFYAMYNAYQSSLTAASKANSQTLLDYL